MVRPDAYDEKASAIVGDGTFSLTLGTVASAPASTIPALASVIELWATMKTSFANLDLRSSISSARWRRR